MPKKKNYEAPRVGKAPNDAEQQPSQTAQETGARTRSDRPASDADIDLVELLGPDARLAGLIRTIVLSRALGRGIDQWVFASADAIRRRLLAGISTATGVNYGKSMLAFFDFLTVGATSEGLARSRPATTGDLKPLHLTEFIAWLNKRENAEGRAASSTRFAYQCVKGTVLAMFHLRLIQGEPHRFFKRRVYARNGESRTTSLSDAEQQRLAEAIKTDLSRIHHGRLEVTMRELQGLRLLVVAHRKGLNTTPLLELTRDAMKPGLLPRTILVRTLKHRGRTVNTQMWLDGPTAGVKGAALNTSLAATEHGKKDGDGQAAATEPAYEYLPFSLAEGAVIGLAIASTEHLVAKAPKRLQNRVWLFEVSHTVGGACKGDVSALSANSLVTTIRSLVKRHKLLGDDGKPLSVNTSRLRKSKFDRAFRISDGDLSVTANLMGNTPQVAGANYPSMNAARQAEAARFMNADYIGMMREVTNQAEAKLGNESRRAPSPTRPIEIRQVGEVQTPTPVAGCGDVLGGEHAPKNGNPCDRFVMCLFCSSFAIVGTVDELWRLFSFQAFARVELAYLEERLGLEQQGDKRLEDLQDLRDRYRLAIPHIDNFTKQQFAASRVEQARAKTTAGLHPFWVTQMALSRRARSGGLSGPDTFGANDSQRRDRGSGDQGIDEHGDGRYGT